MQLMRFAWKTKIIAKGGTTRSSSKQPAKITFAQIKRRTLQNIIYPPKEKKNLLEKHLEVKVVWPTDPFLHY